MVGDGGVLNISHEPPELDATLARRLVCAQFAHWAHLSIHPVARGGWDNRTFHLGAQMVIRMPSTVDYAAQVEKEQLWLPRLARSLSLPIPEPLAMGEPAEGYPWRWSIYRWIDGETAVRDRIIDLSRFARDLAQFLAALQRIDATEGPPSGAHNFYRGGALTVYDAETRQAIAILDDRVDVDAVIEIWENALATIWQRAPLWVHGDISAGNLLVHRGQLSAVIDFGQLGTGDPACDLAIAWTLFDRASRDDFHAQLSLETGTWARGRGWALWKALIVASGLTNTNAIEATEPWRIINEVIADHRCNE